MLRAPSPDIVSESILTGVGCGVWANAPNAQMKRQTIVADKLWIVFIALELFS